MKKMLLLSPLLIALGAGGAVYWFKSHPQLMTQAAAAAHQGTEVSVIQLQSGPISIMDALPGRTTAYNTAEIRPQINGIVTKRLFTEGTEVKMGDPLYQIDAAPYQAALDSAKADMQKAKANLRYAEARTNRYQKLAKTNAVSEQDYEDILVTVDQAKADLALAKAAVHAAQINLDYTKVYAPLTGLIGKSSVTEGALVTSNQTQALAVITQLDPMYVDLTQSTKDRLNADNALQAEQTVSLFLEDNITAYNQSGVLKFSEVTVDPTTGSLQLRALFPNPEHRLLPGLFVRAQMNHEVTGFLVPQKAATFNADGHLSIWVVGHDNTVQPKSIQPIREVGDQWLVVDGLKDGDTIVTAGFQKIAPGALVKPAPIS